MCQFLTKKSATAGNQNSHAATLVIFAKAERVITPSIACKRPELLAMSVSHNFCYSYKHPGRLAASQQKQKTR
jgi:hypothetical protein